MPAKLNHTIVASKDKNKAALFLSEMLDLDPPHELGPFAVVTVGDELTIDFVDTHGSVEPRHFAFKVSEDEFDVIFTRIKERGLDYWADPRHAKHGEINHWDDGRGVYFDDPNGHNLEILTRSYGSAGTLADQPHPLIMDTIEEAEGDDAGARSGGDGLTRHEQPNASKGGDRND